MAYECGWHIAQVNWTGMNDKVIVENMRSKSKETIKSVMWQHNTLPLVLTAWTKMLLLSLVKSLNNFYSLIINKDGVQSQY